jgi:hypothetical protein
MLGYTGMRGVNTLFPIKIGLPGSLGITVNLFCKELSTPYMEDEIQSVVFPQM